MSHDSKSLISVASMLLVNAGFQDPRTWQIGSESAYIIFNDKQGQAYSLEFGGEDGTYLESICVLKGDAEKAYDQDLSADDTPTLWTMDIGTPAFTTQATSKTDADPWDYDLRVYTSDLVLVLGALATFLYDFREGKVNG